MGYLSSLKEGFMLYCTRGHFIRQSDPQGLSLGKTVVIDQEAGECPECDRSERSPSTLWKARTAG